MTSAEFQSKNPTILVILGATGDLTRRKLAPAIFRLYQKKLLPPFFQIVAFSRRDMSTEEFQNEILLILGKHHFPREEAEKFSKLFLYVQGFFEEKNGYDNLAKILGRQDEEWRTCANKLFYLAVPPQYYKTIFQNLSSSGLTEPCSSEEGWTRVIVEKPFGSDLKTAEELDKMLGSLFQEEQIYRIDHYLGKETVQNILAFRFSNSFWEGVLNSDYVQEIKIRLWEKGSVGSRGEFYDKTGALRDVGQNHLLQLLALLTMDNPENFDGELIRKKRAEVLSSLEILDASESSQRTVRGQYRGYRKAKGVSRNSDTETYFRIKTFLNTPRWAGVPIILEGGKKMSKNDVEMEIVFRHQTPCLCPPAQAGEPQKHLQNVLRYEIQPKEKISASFWVKRPGTKMVLEEKNFSFDYKKAYPGSEFADAYEKLLLDVFHGNQTLFVSTGEISASWKFIDPISGAWRKNNVPLQIYNPGSVPETERNAAISSAKIKKEIGIVGLGKMGMNIAEHLWEKGWEVSAFDKSSIRNQTGIIIHENLENLIKKLNPPRLIWLFLPAGKPVEETLFGKNGLGKILGKGDIVVDGGNSFYEDSVRRAERLKKSGINFLDVGVSGGPAGARNGASLMIGGDKKIFEKMEYLFRDLSVAGGYAYVGKSGAGHFVKMVHNGIEYGIMQSLAEGFSILKKSPFRLDLKKIAGIYNHGSVIESRLVGWLEKAFWEYGEELKEISGSVAHTGEGEWTVKTAQKLGVPAKIIKESFEFRVQSAKNPNYAGKILSALRNQFGGHDVKNK